MKSLLIGTFKTLSIVAMVFAAFVVFEMAQHDKRAFPYADAALLTAGKPELEDHSANLIETGYQHDVVNGKRVFMVKYLGEFNVASSFKFANTVHGLAPMLKTGDVVLLSIESGGGDASACMSDNDLVKRLKSTGATVVTHTNVMAASCGYMLLSSGDKALASTGATVGNVGAVRIVTGATKGLVVGTSRIKELLAGAAPTEQSDVDILRQLSMESGARFLRIITENRPGKFSKEALMEIVTAKPFSGKKAVELGLIDGLVDLNSLVIDYHKSGYSIYVVK